MSIYKNEDPSWFRKAIFSITEGQDRSPDEVVLVSDGPLGPELENEMARASEYLGEKLKLVRLDENVGLGLALREGLEHCGGDLVARMDTDDIARSERLRLQEEYMVSHPDVAACGGDIAEFENEGETIRVKKMPSSAEDVYKYGKKRNPLNHMTVMFRKNAVIKAGSYQHFPLLEDYHLWSRLLAGGEKIENLGQILVDARIGKSFAGKRGGREYYEWYKKLRRLQKAWGYLNGSEYVVSLALTFAMTRQSSRGREILYKILRK